MTPTDVKARIDQFRRPLWTFKEVEDWYGIGLSAAPQSFLAQYRIWAETIRTAEPEVLNNGHLNRCVLELFLQRRELTAIRTAAIRLGMDVESFRKTLTAALENNLVSKAEAEGEFPEAHVYRASILRIHKRFPNLAKLTFGDYPSFCRRLHEEIREKLKVSVTTRFCPDSENSGDEHGDIGHDIDIITQEPMGLPHRVWFDTNKPIQLEPDCCSRSTYDKYKDLLAPYVWPDQRELEPHMESRGAA